MSNQTWKVAESIGVEQAQAMDDVLALLDAAVPHKFIALFGSRNSASVLLGELLGKQLLRTPGHRKLMGLLIDATRLPSHIEAWQHLIFCVLDKLGEAPTASRTVINSLRDELNELVQKERMRDSSAGLSSAAFAAHFRSAFPGLVNASVGASNSLLVLGIDKLDQIDGVFAMDLLEASKYFLNSPDCATLMAADEKPLIEKLKSTSASAARLIVTWPTEHVVVPERVITRTSKAPLRPGGSAPAAAAGKRADLGTVPSDSARVIKELLEPDQRAINAACAEWHRANEQLEKRNADGHMSRVTGTHIAKLVALKAISPRVFNAAKFDAPLLSRLERAARSGNADMHDELQRHVALTSQLTAVFKSAPNFVGVEPRDVATALRFVYGGENEPAKPAPAPAAAVVERSAAKASPFVATPEPQPRARSQSITLALSPLLTFVISALAIVGVDRLAKWASAAPAVLPNLTNRSMVGNAAMLGLELFGLAITLLIYGFWGYARKSALYQAAFGLIIGGLGSNLFDHIQTGGVVNFLPVFGLSLNLAHLGLLAGAILLLASMFQPREQPATA